MPKPSSSYGAEQFFHVFNLRFDEHRAESAAESVDKSSLSISKHSAFHPAVQDLDFESVCGDDSWEDRVSDRERNRASPVRSIQILGRVLLERNIRGTCVCVFIYIYMLTIVIIVYMITSFYRHCILNPSVLSCVMGLWARPKSSKNGDLTRVTQFWKQQHSICETCCTLLDNFGKHAEGAKSK